MRVVAWPAYRNRDENPYNSLLYDALRERGIDVVEYRQREPLPDAFDVFHIHWPDLVLRVPSAKGGEKPRSAPASVGDGEETGCVSDLDRAQRQCPRNRAPTAGTTSVEHSASPARRLALHGRGSRRRAALDASCLREDSLFYRPPRDDVAGIRTGSGS